MRIRQIYVVGVTDNPVKIGFASNIRARLAGLQVGNPDPLQVFCALTVPERFGQAIERAVHAHFAAQHRQGEWFNVHKDEAIEAVRRIADELMDENAVEARAAGDDLDQLRARYWVEDNARPAWMRYMTKRSGPGGARSVRDVDAFIAAQSSTAAYTLFRKVFVEGHRMEIYFIDLGLRLGEKDKAEAALVTALNALATYERRRGLIALAA